ncbi:MAG: sigma-70 family RNA polymerase sigma factor [Acidobacteriota bacterium]|nr:MAG: sigma-70 family RNA polymerase sigma factor [Acidobacteriota bacterium]
MSGDSGEKVQIRPLTRENADGEVFVRRPAVEAQILSLTGTAPDEIASRALIPKGDSERYLREETLVYFFREWRRQLATGENDVRKEYALLAVFEEIERRFYRYLRKSRHRPRDKTEFADWARSVSDGFVEKLMDLETDRIDFAEVRFLSFAAMEALGKAKKTKADSARKSSEISIDDDDREGPPIEPILDALSPEQEAMLREGLLALPLELREVVILLDFEGWNCESNDPNELTVSRYLGVTSRTIRNRHEKARRILRDYIGGER